MRNRKTKVIAVFSIPLSSVSMASERYSIHTIHAAGTDKKVIL